MSYKMIVFCCQVVCGSFVSTQLLQNITWLQQQTGTTRRVTGDAKPSHNLHIAIVMFWEEFKVIAFSQKKKKTKRNYDSLAWRWLLRRDDWSGYSVSTVRANRANANSASINSTAAGESDRRRGAAKMAPVETENTELLQPTTETTTLQPDLCLLC